MAYIYELEVRMAAPRKAIDLSIDKNREVIKNAVSQYNDCSFEMANPKTLLLDNDKIKKESVFMTLKSSLPLNSPGRALKTLSRIIIKDIKDEGFIASIGANGRLFSISLIEEKEEKGREEPETDYSRTEDIDIPIAIQRYLNEGAACYDLDNNFQKIRKITVEMMLNGREEPGTEYSWPDDRDIPLLIIKYLHDKRPSDSTLYRKKRAAFERIKKITVDSGMIRYASFENGVWKW